MVNAMSFASESLGPCAARVKAGRRRPSRRVRHRVVLESLEDRVLLSPSGRLDELRGAATPALLESGEFWQHETFDHLVRNPDQYDYLRRYIAENPQKAGFAPGTYHYRRHTC
jgi:hypothetical protein